MSNLIDKQLDLEKRTGTFAVKIIQLLRKLPQDSINKRMIEQLIGSSGSIGANYMEANASESKKDFIHKMKISKKEIKETQHWLRLLAEANVGYKEEFRLLWKENQELLFIFSKAISSCSKRTGQVV